MPHTRGMSVSLTPAEYIATCEKIAKVNDRAVKRGFTGRLEVTGERIATTTTDALGFEVTEITFEATITGTAPAYNGWVFLARVDRLGDSFTLATAPGVEHVSREDVKPGQCDHCHADRNRNNTYLVKSVETGEIKNVGSTCIKDFLGWDASFVFYGDTDLASDLGGFAGTGEHSYSVDTILAYAYAATRAFGFTPASSFTGTPTAHVVRLGLGMYRATSQADKDMLRTLRAYAAEATAKAAEVKAYVLSDDFAGDSTYVDNLKVAAAAEYVTYKQVGLLASAPQALVRFNERNAAKAAVAAQPESQWIANEGDKKVEVTGEIKGIRYISGQYGTTTLYTIVTAEGNVVKWFSSSEALGEDTGRTVTLVGTVKQHEEYQGRKATVMTRCKEVVSA